MSDDDESLCTSCGQSERAAGPLVGGDSLALGRLLGGDLLRLLAAHHQVVAACDGARLCGVLGHPEGDLPVQRGHGQLLSVGPVADGQTWGPDQFTLTL